MNYYNSQALTHAGYVLALIIGIFTLISSEKIWQFYSLGRIQRWGFYVLLSSILGSIAYFLVKIWFWSSLGTAVLVVTMDNAKSTNSSTLIYGIQRFAMQGFSNSSFPFISNAYSVTSSGVGFTPLSYFFYLVLPIIFFLFIFGVYEFVKNLHKGKK